MRQIVGLEFDSSNLSLHPKTFCRLTVGRGAHNTLAQVRLLPEGPNYVYKKISKVPDKNS